jgi:hypothetical protein
MSTFKTGEANPAHLALAKAHGKRVEGRDGDYIVVAYHWQGDVYITEIRGPKDSPGSQE